MKRYDILFVDFMVEDTHRYYCNRIIKEVNKYSSTFVVEKNEYMDYAEDDNHKIVYIKTKETVNNYPIVARVNVLYNFFNTLKVIRGYEFKKIIVLGYDPVMFSFIFPILYKKGDIFLVQHHQLDEVDKSKIKQKLWSIYKDEVNHILLDEAIIDGVSQQFMIKKNKLFFFPIPLIENAKLLKETENNKIKVLCISGSNDKKQLKDFVRYYGEVLKENNIELIIKKDFINLESENDAIVMVNNYLSDDEYNKIYREIDIVLMLFPKDYKYRCSGTIIDAFSYNKKVISSPILEAVSYKKKFPDICTTYNSLDEIIDLILEMNELPKDGFDKFKSEYLGIESRCAERICEVSSEY